jgi:hypothetical protein
MRRQQQRLDGNRRHSSRSSEGNGETRSVKPNWQPLIEKLGQERCVGFMYMARINGINL